MRLAEVVLGPDPAAGLVAGGLLLNLAAAGAVLAVAAARLPAQRFLGPAAAYGLWRLVAAATVVAGLGVFFLGDMDAPSAAARLAAAAPWLGWLAPLWAAGAVGLALLFAAAQLRFARDAARGAAGPAVVGVIAPRIVLPADDRYSDHERELVRAHERAHIGRKDPRGAAWAALFQCLAWFNPAAHLAAWLMRLDQELACDAAVILRHPGARAAYGRALLKTQLAGRPLPLGCYWGQHPLETRIAALKRRDGRTAPASTAGYAPVEPIRP